MRFFNPLSLCIAVFSLYAMNASSSDFQVSSAKLGDTIVENPQNKDSSVVNGEYIKQEMIHHNDVNNGKTHQEGNAEILSKTISPDKNNRDSDSEGDMNKYEIQDVEIKKLKATQNELLLKIDELTKNMYLSNENFGDKNGPGYFYRFSQSKDTKKSENGFYYIYDDVHSQKTKRRNVETPAEIIHQNDFVSFSLKETLPDGTIISETPVLTLLNDDKLPDIVKAAFSVGKKNSVITIVALAKQVYITSNDYPAGVKPDTSIIYKFNISNIKSNNDLNLLKRHD